MRKKGLKDNGKEDVVACIYAAIWNGLVLPCGSELAIVDLYVYIYMFTRNVDTLLLSDSKGYVT